MKRIHVWISGRVQGVFFRQSALREAVRLGLAGWVCNLPDGRVEGVAEGPSDAVEAWLAWCRRGPAGAQVDVVQMLDEPPEGAQGFRIRAD